MKKKWIVGLVLIAIAATASVIILTSASGRKEKLSFSPLLPRKASLSYSSEWAMINNNATIFLQKIRTDPADKKSMMGLTAIYLQEARITGNYNYYNDAALKCIEAVLEKDPENFEALTFKTSILLSQHRFEDGLETAEQARKLYPFTAYIYGLLVDANVELGKYKDALEAADKMVSIRPDIRSYSRIAYLREIHGDLPGAIEAMALAVDAGAPGDENTEWCRVQLGKLYEKTGKIKEAQMHYTIATANRENYPYALSGLAGIAAEENDYSKALSLYMTADSMISDHTFKEGIAEVYKLMNQPEKAKTVSDNILAYMQQFSSDGKRDNKTGQNEDHEMAHAYMGVGQYDKALTYALKEYDRRQANIEVNETVALVYYGKREFAKAIPYITTALSTNCKNPELLCYAGLIYGMAGDKEKAKTLLQEALKNNPVISASLKHDSEEMLKTMK